MTISAVVTTYNRRDLLKEALASIRAQTRLPDEIIVIDDGSTDDTASLLNGETIRYHRQENAGTSAARNTGWQLAKGAWIAYLDSDDLWEKDKLALQERAIKNADDVDAVFGHAVNFAEPSQEARYSESHRLGVSVPGWLPGAGLVRRSLLETMGGFNTGLKTAEVVEWIMRLRERNARMVMLPQVVLRRRLHGGNKQLEAGPRQSENFALLRQWRARQGGAGNSSVTAQKSTTVD